MFFWHVPEPDAALLISGSKHKDGATQFRVVTGHGAFVVPVKQRCRELSLALREAEITEKCVTKQGIPLELSADAVFKVCDDLVSIANAGRRFLAEQNRMEELCGRIFAGHLRSIVGSLTVEEIIRERDKVAQEVTDASHGEMEKLGIVVDGFQIQEIGDPTRYIENLAAPHAAAVASQARIAWAENDQAAAESEQIAARAKTQYSRETQILQAQAEQDVVVEKTRLADREADLTAKRLESEVQRPADAEAYRVRAIAEAERDALESRASALAGQNQALIAANRLVEMLPQLVESAAAGIAGANLTVLNGSQGVGELTTGVVAQGLAIFESLRHSLVTAAPEALEYKEAEAAEEELEDV